MRKVRESAADPCISSPGTEQAHANGPRSHAALSGDSADGWGNTVVPGQPVVVACVVAEHAGWSSSMAGVVLLFPSRVGYRPPTIPYISCGRP
jgi:hypothetical protein